VSIINFWAKTDYKVGSVQTVQLTNHITKKVREITGKILSKYEGTSAWASGTVYRYEIEVQEDKDGDE